MFRGFELRAGRLFAALALLLAASSGGQAADFAASDQPLTNVAQVHRAASGERPAFHQIELRGNVLWLSSARDEMVLQDDSGVALVQMDLREQPIQVGQKILFSARCGLSLRSGGEIRLSFATVDNDGIHGEQERSGEVFLSAGRHPLRLGWFNRSTTGMLKVYYAAPNGERTRIPAEKIFRASAVANGVTNWVNGLDYRCITGKWERVPDFDSHPALTRGVTTNFDVGVAPRTDRVGIEFTGFIDVTQPGVYTFATKSDDGSRLLIGGSWVRCETLGAAELPSPIPATIGRTLGEEQEFAWVQAEGQVTFAGKTRRGWELELSSRTAQMFAEVASVPSNAVPPKARSRVRVTGVWRNVHALDGSISAGKLLVPKAEYVEVLEMPAAAFASSNAVASNTVLRTIEQIHLLPREQAKRELPVKIRGVVTCAVEGTDNGMIQDETRGIFVPNLAPAPGEFARVGDLLEVDGVTAAGDFAPVIYADRVKRLGVAPLPAPRRVTWDQLMNGSLDIQFVEFEGLVAWVRTDSLVLLMHGGQMNVRLVDPEPPKLDGYENAVVRLRGCLSAIWSGRTHQVKPGMVLLHTWKIEVVQPAPTDLFATRLKHASELLQFDPLAGAFQRVKVAGQVVHVRGNELFVMDGPDGLRCTPKRNEPISVGDQVELAGFPVIGETAPVLRNAIVRRTGHGALPEPRSISETNLFEKPNDATIVTFEARVSNLSTDSTEQVLELRAGSKTVLARLNAKRGSLASVPIGSLVKLTGVYVATLASPGSKNYSSFELLLDSPADLKILERAPWWTTKHTLAALGISLAVLLLASAWIYGLRQQVERRTRELKREIEQRKRAQQELEITHKKLLTASHQAGMAEVATSVLHNVGNVLNSVNVSATLLADRARQSKLTALGKLADLLQRERNHSAFLASDEKGRQIPDYVKRLSEQAQHEREAQLKEIASLQKNVEHIKSIVMMQQSYASMGGVAEETSAGELLEDAVRINNAAFERHSVKLVRDFQINPEIVIERHKVLQILVNLLRNAKQACCEAGGADRQITLRILSEGPERVRIEVVDNGTGIAPENLSCLFTQGFTTRKHGHGFGLHSAINLARELGGTLTAQSDGLGCGATFALTLRIAAADANPRLAAA